MKPKVYIDGQEGTTGLQIMDRLKSRQDITLLCIESEQHRNVNRRRELMNAADLVFLCLPDQAAREAVTLIDNPDTRVIDASTAHRVDPLWVYGFAELAPEQREKIRSARLVANPGCHATGFLSAAAPLIKTGILPEDYPVSAYSLTGYSGGGKKMIAQYEGEEREQALLSPRVYGLNMHHKHLPEMQKYSGLHFPPAFSPVVDDYYKGMTTVLTFQNRCLAGNPNPETIFKKLQAYYSSEPLITVALLDENAGMLAGNALAGKDSLQLWVGGNEDQTIVAAQFDNLGKGASGAAVQNMNIMLNFPENRGLNL